MRILTLKTFVTAPPNVAIVAMSAGARGQIPVLWRKTGGWTKPRMPSRSKGHHLKASALTKCHWRHI